MPQEANRKRIFYFVLAQVTLASFLTCLIATGQDTSLQPGPAKQPTPKKTTTTTSTSKATTNSTDNSQALLSSPDAKQAAVFKCASFQTPRAKGTFSATYNAGCPLEVELISDSGRATSRRLADVFAKSENQPLTNGDGTDTQLAAAIKQLLTYAYNGEPIFPEDASYIAVHVVDRQGAVGQAQAGKQTGETTVAPTKNSSTKKGSPATGTTVAQSKDTAVAVVTPADAPAKLPLDRWILVQRKSNGKLTLSEDTRIFGVSKMAMLFVHVNATIDASLDPVSQFGDVSYRMIAKAKLPQNIADLLGILQVAVGLFQSLPVETKVAYMGFGNITRLPVPSDVTYFGFETVPDTSAGARPGATALQLIGQSIQYDNEGKYWWDASIGVPINKLSLLDYSQDTNVFTPKTINKQSVYGMVDVFFHPVDLKHVERIPHAVVGLGLTGRPGENFMVGLAWGIPQLQFFAGQAFANHNVMQGGSVEQRYANKWVYGINLPVASAIKQLAAKKNANNDSSTSTPSAKAAAKKQ